MLNVKPKQHADSKLTKDMGTQQAKTDFGCGLYQGSE
jgi:hypothetical protein